MSLADESVLLTGGTGFVGRSIARALISAGIKRIVYVGRNKPLHMRNEDDFVDVDLALMSLPDDRHEQITTIVHAAARIPDRTTPDFDAWRDNIRITENLITPRYPHCTAIVHISTADVYGVPTSLPTSENHGLHPRTYYAASKAACESLLDAFAATCGLKCTHLRLTHIFGPGEPIIKAIPTFVSRALNGQSIEIMGTGHARRDYLYVEDAAQGVVDAVQHKIHGIFNISSGIGRSVLETAKTIVDIAGTNAEIICRPSNLPEYNLTWDNTKAARELSFVPQTEFKEGLLRTIDFARKQHH